MAKEDTIKLEGVVEELLPNMTFRVKLENDMRVMAHLCGKMRVKNIRVLVGDHVTVDVPQTGAFCAVDVDRPVRSPVPEVG